MGRPRIYDEVRVATAIRLPTSLRAELRTATRARAVSVNVLVTCAVADYLRRLAPPPADEPTPSRSRGRRSADRAPT